MATFFKQRKDSTQTEIPAVCVLTDLFLHFS